MASCFLGERHSSAVSDKNGAWIVQPKNAPLLLSLDGIHFLGCLSSEWTVRNLQRGQVLSSSRAL